MRYLILVKGRMACVEEVTTNQIHGEGSSALVFLFILKIKTISGLSITINTASPAASIQPIHSPLLLFILSFVLLRIFCARI